MVDPELVRALGIHAAGLAGDEAEPPQVVAPRPVLRSGPVVVKAHPADTDPGPLGRRIAVAGHPALRGLLLPPLGPPRTVAGRLVTSWPAGEPISDPEKAPWAEAGEMLARLHQVPPAGLDLPAAGGPARLRRAVERMPAAAPEAIGAAYRTLTWPDRHDTLVHGDWHLGQLIRFDGQWLLTDPDDLGLGDPAWDLARPAAWFATGLLAPENWWEFLGAYRDVGGPGIPPDGDPWPALDAVARALTVQLAARAVTAAHRDGEELDEAGQLLVGACARIAALPA